jgi:UDP-glucose 4-epimerase
VNVLVAAAETGGTRVVLAGSLEEPDGGDPEPTPVSPYAAAKSASSAYGRMFHSLYGVPVVVLRVFMVYGPGQHDQTKLVPYVITSLLRGHPPELSSGRRPVDWVYVDDVVHALLASATADAAVGETIDVGSGILTPIRGVVEMLVELMRPPVEPAFGALPDRPRERVRVADVARTQAILGWAPGTSLETGLAATIEWFMAQQAAA